MRATRIIPILFCGLVATFTGTGCSTDVAGPPGVDEPFSVYGIINPRLNMQTLLVSSVETELNPISSTIDATVTSTNLHTGAVHEWKDSVATNETGQLDHIFWADFNPDFGSRHRIEVRRSDGATSSVETTIPKLITVEGEDTKSRDFYVMLYGDDFRPLRIDVQYGVRAFYKYPGWEAKNPAMPYSRLSVSVRGKEEKVDGGWRVPIDMNIEYEWLRSRYYHENKGKEPFVGFNNQVCDGLALEDMRISVMVGSDEWDPPGGDFDPFVQSFPRAFSNVQNGFGFVAGGYDHSGPLYPSTASLRDTPFFDSILARRPHVVGCGHYVGA